MRLLARLLQVLALVLLPVAMLLEVSGMLSRGSGVADMLLLMVFGFALFYAGRVLEGYAGE